MIKRTVVVESDARLSQEFGQLVIEREGQPKAMVPIEDLGILLIDHSRTTITSHLLSRLAEAGVSVLVCDEKHMPCGIALPLAGHFEHQGVLRDQIAQSEPSRKRLWQQVVQAKIGSQSALLLLRGIDASPLERLRKRVLSGDAGNAEGQAASRYFTAAFGEEFLRDCESDGTNAWLNYGYALIRAAVARAVCGAGLHPALGIFHANRLNPFSLVDDLMEPLRPMADNLVLLALDDRAVTDQVTPIAKRHLLALLTGEVRLGNRTYPLSTGLGLYAAAFRECMAGNRRKLICPVPVFR